jgi:hypothetical protein
MQKLTFSTVTLALLRQVVNLQERDASEIWLASAEIQLSDRERLQLEIIQSYLIHEKLHLLNEATLWARAIYPLLLIAEKTGIRAWSEVPLSAVYSQFEVDDIADGVMGYSVAGRLEMPYLVVVETKRGVENQNPIFQLYAQLLAAARLNWEGDSLQDSKAERAPMQEIFGCYTIADSWTFVRAEVSEIESDRPTLKVESSQEYSEKSDAETILKVLKSIVAKRG